MSILFVTTLAIGVAVLLLQLVLGLTGIGHHDVFDDGGHDGLDLFTVRALAAAAAAFGVVGLLATRGGLPTVIAVVAASIAAAVSAFGVASAVRAMRRFEVDKSFDIAMTLGLEAKVSLSIPGARAGEGKVHVIAHERFLELNAVTADGDIPHGAVVTVVDTLSSDTVVVSRTPLLSEELQ
jgi:hypothetical protein